MRRARNGSASSFPNDHGDLIGETGFPLRYHGDAYRPSGLYDRVGDLSPTRVAPRKLRPSQDRSFLLPGIGRITMQTAAASVTNRVGPLPTPTCAEIRDWLVTTPNPPALV